MMEYEWTVSPIISYPFAQAIEIEKAMEYLMRTMEVSVYRISRDTGWNIFRGIVSKIRRSHIEEHIKLAVKEEYEVAIWSELDNAEYELMVWSELYND